MFTPTGGAPNPYLQQFGGQAAPPQPAPTGTSNPYLGAMGHTAPTGGLGSSTRNWANPFQPAAANTTRGLSAAGAAGAGGPMTSGPLSGPGYSENYYKQHGNDLMTPSASEKLYAEGDAGSNPYYNYAEQQSTNSINAAERARGGFNSGAALSEIGNASANLRGQQAHELGQLAGQADTAKEGRYGLTGQMADTAQSQEQNRIMGGISAETGLGNAQAGQVGGFYGTAGSENQQAQMAAIESKLQASHMSAAEVKQYMDMITNTAGTVIKAAA